VSLFFKTILVVKNMGGEKETPRWGGGGENQNLSPRSKENKYQKMTSPRMQFENKRNHYHPLQG